MDTPRPHPLARTHLHPAHKPAAYFISFRTYGTWLHGSAKGSVDYKHNGYKQPCIQPHEGVENAARSRMKHDAVNLNLSARQVVEQTIVEVCAHRRWVLRAKNIRTNHVHTVITAAHHTPERVANDLKAWCTRRLRETGIMPPSINPWSRGRSNPYLWTDDDMHEAIKYVMEGQGDDLHDKP